MLIKQRKRKIRSRQQRINYNKYRTKISKTQEEIKRLEEEIRRLSGLTSQVIPARRKGLTTSSVYGSYYNIEN